MLALSLVVFPFLLAAPTDLTFEGASPHPTVFISPEDAVRARERVQSDPEAKSWFESLTRSVAAWDDKDPSWVKTVMPGEGACFAYGFTGCPICGAGWGTWGSARASFENPGHVTCTNGHVLPDEDHPDTGPGYVADDGRIHYFVGSYNAWVVETLTFKVAEPYANIYLLTGDERAGRMAAVILDEIARIYPSCDKGSWDYPSDPPSGRLNRPWYQVARVLVHYVDIYDRIFDHPALDEPSSVEGQTRRRNIEQNLLLNAAAYCYEMSVKTAALHNGEADYLRGVLAVGVVLGIPEYVEWPVDGTYGIRTMLANNVDRDGRYFETSVGYGLHTRNLYLTFAEPLLNYRGSLYPNGLNLYDDPRFEAFYLLPQMAFICLGHSAPFGDQAPAKDRRSPPYNPPAIADYVHTERLAVRLSDPKKRAQYAALLEDLRLRDPKAEKRTLEWKMFHAPDRPPTGHEPLNDRMKQLLEGSFFFGQKGFVVLRQPSGPVAHAAVLRFGPSLVHGHYDDLNVNYFSDGYEMTYDLGYALGSTHTQVGWAKQTISHNTVVVDEESHGGGAFGGSLHHFMDFPRLTVSEASSTAYAHAGVDIYRRLFALADGYALDVFRVRGGRQHDLPLHSLTTKVSFQGVAFSPPRPGSLAGEEYRWGELQLNDGDMKGYPNKPYWNPPPGNGYGFLAQPAFATPESNWSATWLLEEDAGPRFQLLALHDAGSQVITATAPGLYPSFPRARHVIRRRAGDGLSSCFVSVWQTSTDRDSAFVQSIRRIDGGDELTAESGFVFSASLADGKRDIWISAPTSNMTVTARDEGTQVSLHGAFGQCRTQGRELLSVHLLEAKSFTIGEWAIEMHSPHRTASVTDAPGATEIRVDSTWPDDGRYDGDPLHISNSGYSRNAAYTISNVTQDRIRIAQTGTLLGRGVIHDIPDGRTLITHVPHEYARSVTRRGPSGFFQGKLLQTEDGTAATHIREVVFGDPMTIRVDSSAGFKVGQTFYYHDIQPGDNVAVQHYASLIRVSPRTYQLRANTDVTLVAPEKAKIQYLDQLGRMKTAVAGEIPRRDLPPSGETTVTLLD